MMMKHSSCFVLAKVVAVRDGFYFYQCCPACLSRATYEINRFISFYYFHQDFKCLEMFAMTGAVIDNALCEKD